MNARSMRFKKALEEWDAIKAKLDKLVAANIITKEERDARLSKEAIRLDL